MQNQQLSSKYFYPILRRGHKYGADALRMLPPETAHKVGCMIMNSKIFRSLPKPSISSLSRFQVNVPGLAVLPHPIGMAAGFDKNGECIPGLEDLGFSFSEIGSVTPYAQTGNPTPRIFRLEGQRALINRMGFNSKGIASVHRNLERSLTITRPMKIGINAGKNLATLPDKAPKDYIDVIRGLHKYADYAVINISSPNTEGLRSLASYDFLATVAQELKGINPDLLKRTWIKLDPDQDKKSFQKLVAWIDKLHYAGLVLTNTHKVSMPQKGGISGHPLAITSTQCLEWAWEVHKGHLPMIGCGGILSGSDILQKILRGANCVQLYTAFIYRGPWVVYDLLEELAQEMTLAGFSNIADAWGRFYTDSL